MEMFDGAQSKQIWKILDTSESAKRNETFLDNFYVNEINNGSNNAEECDFGIFNGDLQRLC